jgi:hypothetical protein
MDATPAAPAAPEDALCALARAVERLWANDPAMYEAGRTRIFNALVRFERAPSDSAAYQCALVRDCVDAGVLDADAADSLCTQAGISLAAHPHAAEQAAELGAAARDDI